MYTDEQAHTPSYTQIRHKDTNRFIYTETQTNMVTCTHRLKYILTTTKSLPLTMGRPVHITPCLPLC